MKNCKYLSEVSCQTCSWIDNQNPIPTWERWSIAYFLISVKIFCVWVSFRVYSNSCRLIQMLLMIFSVNWNSKESFSSCLNKCTWSRKKNDYYADRDDFGLFHFAWLHCKISSDEYWQRAENIARVRGKSLHKWPLGIISSLIIERKMRKKV